VRNHNRRLVAVLLFVSVAPVFAVLPPPSEDEREAQGQMFEEARENAEEFLQLEIGLVEEQQRDGWTYLSAKATVLKSYRSRQGFEVGDTMAIAYAGSWVADQKYNEAIERDKIAGPAFRDSGLVRLKRGMVVNAWLQRGVDSDFMAPAAGALSFEVRDGDDDP
jgi:hypothetical protein